MKNLNISLYENMSSSIDISYITFGTIFIGVSASLCYYFYKSLQKKIVYMKYPVKI